MLCDCAHAVPHCPIVLCSCCAVCELCLLCCVGPEVEVGNGGEWQVPSQIAGLVTIGKHGATKPNAPSRFAPWAQILVRIGRRLLMQGPLVFGLVCGHGKVW